MALVRRLVLLLLYCIAGRTCGASSSTRVTSSESEQGLAMRPPRGWNSYNSFSWVITEEEFLENARVVKERLLKFGYEYVVVDWLWYRQLKPGSTVKSLGFDLIDEWGRPIPDPERWPSSKNGQGFRPLADIVHSMGLKLGIHTMHGIVAAAVEQDTPIFGAKGSPDGDGGRPWRASDIAVQQDQCRWMTKCFVGVNTSSDAGLAYINSLYQQFAAWGIDLVKQDCVFGGPDLRLNEIAATNEVADVHQAIKASGRPILYSISPGKWVTLKEAKLVQNMSHTFRVSNDIWDKWGHLRNHFDISRQFTSLIGGHGLHGGRSWPDLDALPLGWLSKPSVPFGPSRWCSFTDEEQRAMVTLWTMARSPLMYGGDLRKLDDWMFNLITHPLVLEINDHSFANVELTRAIGSSLYAVTRSQLDDNRVWAARGLDGQFYLAYFNLGHFTSAITTSLSDMMQQLNAGDPNSRWKCEVVDGWSGRSLGVLTDTISVVLQMHSSTLYVLKCAPDDSTAIGSLSDHGFKQTALTVVAALVALMLLCLIVTSVIEVAGNGRYSVFSLHLSPPISPSRSSNPDDKEPLL